MEEVKSEKLYQIEKDVIIATPKGFFYPTAHKGEVEALEYYGSKSSEMLFFKTKIIIWGTQQE